MILLQLYSIITNEDQVVKIKISYTLELDPDAVKYYKEEYGSDWLNHVKRSAEINGSLAVEEDWCDWDK